MTSISKNMCIDKLDDIVNKYNHTYYGATKMKNIAVKSTTFIDFNEKNNKEGPEFSVGNHINIRISKYTNIFAKCYVPNWL